MINTKYKRVLVVTAWLFLLAGNYRIEAQQKDGLYPLIPYPTSLAAGAGYFTITSATTIVTPGNRLFKTEANILSDLFNNSFGEPLKQAAKASGQCIRLLHDPSITAPEAYRLQITTREVSLSAGSPAGMFMGIQTIRQLLPPSIETKAGDMQKSMVLPAVTIKDAPAYAWRGIHLDVSRHFFSIAYLEKLVDLMALYKLNKFHLHLTDDQGWRIEIKKYPKLTEEGAWRTFNNHDSACMKAAVGNPDFNIDARYITEKNGKKVYGGFYTQKEMKELVQYAAARHIDIIPEIDMPGHMMAAINAYNYLSCDGKSGFGELFSTPVCPCLPSTFQFAKDVLREIMDIFPSRYIHIGGDEVDRSHWAKSEECKALMQKEGLKSTAELQAWFIRRMEDFFHENGKELIGWDEILDGGISRTALIMYWRTWVPNAPVEAARNGNKVIMTPGSPLYFNQQPDKNSLPAVHNYNPIPVGLSKTEAANIIGAQANLWTEQVPSEKRADYLLMPRMTALAERLWTNNGDYTFYLRRLDRQYARLDQLKVNYRLPDLPLLESYAFTDKAILAIEKPMDDLIIRYTVDGTLPGTRSTVLADSLVITTSQSIRLAAFKQDGTRGDIYGLQYKKQDLAEPSVARDLSDGLICNWYKKYFNSTTLIPVADPDGSAIVSYITVPAEAEAASFALQYRGYIEVPGDGIYSFYLTSDDGSVLKIAGRPVVDNDGMHSAREGNGQVALKKGLHAIALDFVEGGGGYALKLQYSKNGNEPKDIPAEWFKH